MRFACLVLAASAVVFVTPRAEACGGCFHQESPKPADGGPPQAASVVTDHRMAIALSATSTTLWDQIEYAGDPEEFAWILPVKGPVTIGLGNNAFLEALDVATAPRIEPPKVMCNPPPYSPPSGGGGGGGASPRPRRPGSGDGLGAPGCGCSSDDSYEGDDPSFGEDAGSSSADAPSADCASGFDGGPPDEGVIITSRETVGPYETVQISSTSDDSEPLVTWLAKNKFVVPDAVKPIIAYYTKEKFDFVALKLRPGKGVTAMRPIRITWAGADPRLPLRMVAAGAGNHVGLKLFVIGDGRWRTQNFPTYSVSPDDLSWDFKISRSNYTTLREAGAATFGGRAWALESSIDLSSYAVAATDPPQAVDAGTGGDASAEVAADAGGSDATVEVSDALDDSGGDSDDAAAADAADAADAAPKGPAATDVEVAFGKSAARRVSRLRADLKVEHLDTDLLLEADEVQAAFGPTYAARSYTNESYVCPWGVAYTSPMVLTPPAPASITGARTSCAVPARASGAFLPLGIVGVLLSASVARRRLRSRS